MPHTNRARRADHYRSIDNNSNSSSNNLTNNKQGGRRHAQRGQDDGGAFDQNLDSRTDALERYGGRSGGRGAGGRGAGRGRQGGAFGRGGGARAAGGPVAGAPTTATAGSKGKSKMPSVKNRIRSLTRLMNKPVRVCGCVHAAWWWWVVVACFSLGDVSVFQNRISGPLSEVLLVLLVFLVMAYLRV